MSSQNVKNNTPLVLIIDDDATMRVSMRAAMLKFGFDCVEAATGFAGINLCKTHRPDLILLDVLMPEINGFETCSTLRHLPGGANFQILMVTGLDDLESIEKAFEVGADGFISKPINWLMLGHRCRYMIRASQAIQEMHRGKIRLTQTQKLAKLGSWEISLKNNSLLCSQEGKKLLGLPDKDILLSLDEFLSTTLSEERDSVKQAINKALLEKNSFSTNHRVTHKDGSIRHILNQGEILYSDFNEPEILLGAVQDVTELKIAEEEIRLLAFYDGLTGLANRMLFQDKLSHEIQAAKRNKEKLALLYLDLDQFKNVNDTFGHHFGDLLLKKISEVLKKCIRGSDIASRLGDSSQDTVIARLGGDEFTVLLTDIKQPEYAALVARRILRATSNYLTLEGHEIAITTSIGISIYPLDGTDSDILLKNADTAMYHAKNKGRNNYQFFVKELNIAAVERFNLERDISKAIERNDFSLYYQPKVNLKSLKITGAEALIRWKHSQRGMVSPGVFIPIAEESGLINIIDQWVFTSACSQWKLWIDEKLTPGILAVNLSGRHFGQENLIKSIEQNLNEIEIPPEDIEIEITENILMNNTESTVATLNRIRKLGIFIALDDFGTGYSSLSYLSSFQVNTIKIDRSFVTGCVENRSNLIIIKAIIAIGHSLGMKIVAEGIETAEELALLQHLGVDEAQGYYFSPPIPAVDFQKLLRKNSHFSQPTSPCSLDLTVQKKISHGKTS